MPALPPLTGPLRYLIGADDTYRPKLPDEIVELSYDAGTASHGETAYGNLRDEQESGHYAPYLPGDDITDEYGELCPDPHGRGYMANVAAQIARAVRHGAVRLEFDNPDSKGLDLHSVLLAHDAAWNAGLRTVGKNPLALSNPNVYLSHPSIDLAIVERGPFGSDAMDRLRRQIGQPLLAVRFVAFRHGRENGLRWLEAVAANIRHQRYKNMGCTFSSDGEYTSASDILLPHDI